MCSSENEERKEGQKRENSSVYFWSRRIEKWRGLKTGIFILLCFQTEDTIYAVDNDGEIYYTERKIIT